jgi:ABC-type siderophore export system fused ATPase/permease subunit
MNKEYQEIRPATSESEINDMIERLARFIAERHLGPAGILFLESVRPLHGIGSQAMFFILPFAEIIFDSKKYQHFAMMMEKEDNLKKLVARIDELDEELSRDRRKQNRLKNQRRKAQFKAFMTKIFKPHNKNA